MRVSDAEGARSAEEHGAKAIAVDRAIDGIRTATSLPLLWIGEGPAVDADARTIRPDDEAAAGELEHVVDVRDEDELERASERHDPEIFLLSAPDDADDDPIEAILGLLPDIPAGKLAIANAEEATRDEVLSLERAGIDAVLVQSSSLAGLVS